MFVLSWSCAQIYDGSSKRTTLQRSGQNVAEKCDAGFLYLPRLKPFRAYRARNEAGLERPPGAVSYLVSVEERPTSVVISESVKVGAG